MDDGAPRGWLHIYWHHNLNILHHQPPYPFNLSQVGGWLRSDANDQDEEFKSAKASTRRIRECGEGIMLCVENDEVLAEMAIISGT